MSNGSLTDANTGYHYIHTDHLGTPIVATGKDGSITWKAVTEAFGATGALPESVIQMNLRFPGQYFDSEMETHYNFNRDYRSNLGRYIQSDPIGLRGGQNLFAYVNAKPLVKVDPEGLVDWSGIVVTGGIVNIAGGVVVYFDLTSECVCNKRVRIKGYATFLAAGLGAKFTGSGGSSTFYDHNACPNENAANGLAAGAAISLVTVGGASISATALGSLRSTWPPISTGLLGFDVSAVVMLGASWGRGSTEQCCSK